MSGAGRWADTSGRYPGGGNPNAWPMPDYFALLVLNEAAGDQTWRNVDGRFAAFESGAEQWPEDPDMATVRDVKDVAGAWWAAACSSSVPQATSTATSVRTATSSASRSDPRSVSSLTGPPRGNAASLFFAMKPEYETR